ncbi:MAG: AmmeMemoRadiSam system protein B [Candidatus Altiarchaeota archaeon]|nr:AmmeMemoRadiSam system protein B [Candidatus Altiarchaeota archaeon]
MSVKRVRESVIAGSWYPGNKETLENMLEGFLDKVGNDAIEDVRALICPHAGYAYSGSVAAYGYKQLRNKSYSKVIMLAPSHQYPFQGVSVGDYTHYRTPLGDVPVSDESFELVSESKLFYFLEEAHLREHSLEIQLPFLQMVLDDFFIIPLVFGRLSMDEIRCAADVIIGHLNDETLLVVSTDLSHYHSYEEAISLDDECIKSILSMDMENALKGEMCGKYAVLTAMEIAKKMGWSPQLLKYLNSGDVTGDKSSGVVGYASIVFHGKNKNESAEGVVSVEQQKYLLDVARKSIEAYMDKGMPPKVEARYSELEERAGTFVTLEKNGQLRGCIGNIVPEKKVYISVRDNAINAAFRDPRFSPLKRSELDDLEIEVSILSVPELIRVESPQDYVNEIEAGKDGIIIQKGDRSATYLPQVWEKIPKTELFLDSLCQKATLPIGCWGRGGVEIYRYRVQHFSEGEF